ncbi:glycoside hydrolase family 3 C-terminal domain-containing protein [Paenibacillus sp. FSL E2-8871]|uniref:glycoside hydrolase family 3 C-terminal domain-containing protein n=1 Tax=Paenibacillus sp. FSL E2-8871 TaxID=2975326 RepID=UPI0030F94D69
MSSGMKGFTLRKLVVVTLIMALIISMISTIAPNQVRAADNVAIEFARGASNMPIFDGVPSHLDAFVDLILADMSIEDLAYYADQKSAGTARTIAGGYTLPGTAAGGVDRVMGVSTDMPSMLALGQSWNKDLVSKVGTVMGNERRGEVTLANPNTLMFSAVSDLRTNPLSGRFEEGYAEDPVLAGTMINSMAKGITGYGEAGNEDGFWLKAQLGTKHYTNYLAQWFRASGQFYASARALNEYQMKSFLYPLQAGVVQSIMTTYGRTNGVPNHISPNIIRASNSNPYSMLPVGDFIAADRAMTAGFNNGYQNYTDADGAAALLLLSGNHANTTSSTRTNILNAVNNGTFGVTRVDLENSVRGQIEMWVRTGYFNEKNPDGSPKSYPFSDLASDRSPQIYTLNENQNVALDASRESVVLLKNDNNLLPLSKSSNVAVTGLLADTRFKATYSVSKTPVLPGAGLSPLGAIREAIGSDNVTFGTGAPVIALDSVSNHQTVTASTYTNGAQLTADFIAPDMATVTDSVYVYSAAGKAYTASQAFEAYAWGQGGYSYLSLANGKWLKDVTSGSSRTVQNSDATKLNLVENPFSNVADASTLPGRFRQEANSDGTVSLISGTYSESFGGGFETAYYSAGRFVTVNGADRLDLSSTTLTNQAGAAARTDNQKFQEIVLKEAGADASAWASGNDYAVVVVGAPARHSAGEGADRSDLNLGEDQYKIVSQVAQAFPKKTVVIVKSNAPVNMEAIQNNENVAAIMYQPYAGQYDSKALADVLFGDYAPTGRLSSTWYAGMDALPVLDNYSLPEGATPVTLAELDPRFTVDMTNGDPLESKLTYMYTDAQVTYPFGYGLGYSSFEFSNLSVPSNVSGKEPFAINLDVENAGAVNTSEVVQLYIKNNTSKYGDHTPKKQLVSYEKVYIPAGETKAVQLTVNPSDFAVWDVNRNEYVNETGSYTLMVGKSSSDLPISAALSYNNESIAKLDAVNAPANIFDHAFASKDVVYREVSKLRTAEGLKAKEAENGYYAVMSKNSNSWVALNQVRLSGVTGITLRGASTNASSVVEVRADSPTGTRLAVVTFDATVPAVREVPGSTFKVTELDYTDVTGELLTTLSGTHDLYLVFKNPDIRVDSIHLSGAVPGNVVPTAQVGNRQVTISWPANANAEGYNVYVKEGETYTPITEHITWKDNGLGAVITNLNNGQSYTFAVSASNLLGEGVKSDISVTPRSGSSGGNDSGTTNPGTTATPIPTPTPTSSASASQAPNPDSQPGTSGQSAITFRDISSRYDWARQAIDKLAAEGIIKGTGDGLFSPGGKIKRADFIVMAVRAFKLSSDSTDQFADVNPGTYYAEALSIAKALGIAKGGADGKFIPNAEISRQDMMVLIARVLKAAGKLPEEGLIADLKGFRDASKVSSYAVSSIASLVKAGFVKGDGLNLNPGGTASRAEAAMLIYNTYKK